MRKINVAGLQLIKSFEGVKLRSYKDSVGVWTIGYGHTDNVEPGDVITEAEAEGYLRDDLDDAERAVDAYVTVPLSDNQFAALVSFVFNLGPTAFNRSTLLKVLNQRNYKQAANEFLKWNRAGGKILAGLVRRREAERNLFLTP